MTPNLRASSRSCAGSRSSSAAPSSRSSTPATGSTTTRPGSTSSGSTHVEISDGTLEIPRERKLELIDDFARDFTVLSEVGSKDTEVNYAPYLWVQWIKEELEAGAWKVITEAREGGTAGHLPADAARCARASSTRSRTRSTSPT